MLEKDERCHPTFSGLDPDSAFEGAISGSMLLEEIPSQDTSSDGFGYLFWTLGDMSSVTDDFMTVGASLEGITFAPNFITSSTGLVLPPPIAGNDGTLLDTFNATGDSAVEAESSFDATHPPSWPRTCYWTGRGMSRPSFRVLLHF